MWIHKCQTVTMRGFTAITPRIANARIFIIHVLFSRTMLCVSWEQSSGRWTSWGPIETWLRVALLICKKTYKTTKKVCIMPTALSSRLQHEQMLPLRVRRQARPGRASDARPASAPSAGGGGEERRQREEDARRQGEGAGACAAGLWSGQEAHTGTHTHATATQLVAADERRTTLGNNIWAG